MNGALILGNQLFDPKILRARMGKEGVVFMREDAELCTYFKFHKQKIIFFLSAMRAYRDELEAAGFRVHYESLNQTGEGYEERFQAFLKKEKIQKLFCFEIEDKFFEKRILSSLEKLKIEPEILPSPMFLTTRQQFAAYLSKTKKPFMKTFYQQQRLRLDILVKNKEPEGGHWSFDTENRLSLPKNLSPEGLPSVAPQSRVAEVQKMVEKHFAHHPGEGNHFWLPTTREESLLWLKHFIDRKLDQFGPYEDAIPAHSDFVFHSVLAPMLNCGLLTPEDVVQQSLKAFKKKKISIASVEGFIRQIIGWREFVRGIYQNFSEQQDKANFWNHTHHLSDVWYGGETGVPPLDRALKRVWTRGYLHHIERLMVVGSMMLLLEVDPRQAHKWFMEMFVDSSDWVMGPNVYGMALFSDGGIFATKPYICGSNYYRKMGGDKVGDWCDGVDGLYWSFVKKHKSFFLKNPRLSMMARAAEKMDAKKWKRIEAAADELRGRLVIPC